MPKSKLFKSKNQSDSVFKRFVKQYAILLIVFIVFILGILIGRQTSEPEIVYKNDNHGSIYNKTEKPEFLSKDLNFDLFWDVWQIIEDNYVYQPVNETELLYGSMAGSVAALGDSHSVFFDPETTKDFNDELAGTFEGIGAEIAIKNDRLTIVAPLPDSPAKKAGLRSGDKVFAIDGMDTTGISLDYAVKQIRGPKGTDVVLTIGRDSLDDFKEIKITRQNIDIQSVKWELLENNIVHLEIRYFNEDTTDDFNQAVLEIINKNPRGIILDLRNNPGGFLDTAINVAAEWVEDKVVVYEKSADGKLKPHKVNGRARLKDFSTVVLINEGSASGSEIVAGALKDYNLATLIGETTFGKGSVQTLFPLKDGSSIKLTVAEWLTPNENTIEGDGVEPDMEVELTVEDFNQDLDPQMDKALEVLMANEE
ncbi:MAG: PDZ domain-containing protein [Candidatus Buchananbacteria bacterium]|nr:PDZ domain-containing protein [Candidatus Buchananbacteria bacterium]